jgi:SAM-dependent methyltransferase
MKQYNPLEFELNRFVIECSSRLSDKDIILDAGAGNRPYKKYFSKLAYNSTDIFGDHDFNCNLNNIPIDDNNFTAILCTQVLEHVENPNKVLSEFNRILKKHGKLFLTVPLIFGVHSKENYFNFTIQGIKGLLEKNNFKMIEIKPIGGVFWSMIILIHESTRHISKNELIRKFIRFLFIPMFYILYYLDKLDKEKNWTVGYTVFAIKC